MICFCVLSKVSKDIARFGGFLIGIFFLIRLWIFKVVLAFVSCATSLR